ncbi:MAG: hypothetical protein JWO69_855 [Thermoleophilia bacterium]|nr:hypothetical protein [Thermoleophilia bacterium]
MQLRFITLAATVAALAIIPASAAAATVPVINPPDATSVAKGLPTWTWASSPTGEYIRSISYSTEHGQLPSGDLASTKNGSFLYPLQGLTTATASRAVYAGTYYWTAQWYNDTTIEKGYTPLQSFVVAPYLRGLNGSYIQYSSITAFSAKGTYRTNAKTSRITCRIYKGRKIISRQTKFASYNTIGAKNNFYCSDLKVPERYDGQRLRFNVVVKSGGKTGTANKFFRAI